MQRISSTSATAGAKESANHRRPLRGAAAGSTAIVAMLLCLFTTAGRAEDKAEDKNAQMRSMLQANGHLGECSSCHGKNDPNRYKLDARQSRLIFRADNLGYGPMVGEFHEFEGGFKYDVGKQALLSVIASLRATSLDLGDPLLNAVVRERFLQIDKFPLVTFVATEVKSKGKGHSSVIGELTLLGVTRPLTLDVTLNRSGVHPYDGRMTAGFSARGSILRSDYGLTLGSPTLGDEIHLEIVAIGSRDR